MYFCLLGADRYYSNVMDMIGYLPASYMKYCWKFFTPCIITVSKIKIYTMWQLIRVQEISNVCQNTKPT